MASLLDMLSWSSHWAKGIQVWESCGETLLVYCWWILVTFLVSYWSHIVAHKGSKFRGRDCCHPSSPNRAILPLWISHKLYFEPNPHCPNRHSYHWPRTMTIQMNKIFSLESTTYFQFHKFPHGKRRFCSHLHHNLAPREEFYRSWSVTPNLLSYLGLQTFSQDTRAYFLFSVVPT